MGAREPQLHSMQFKQQDEMALRGKQDEDYGQYQFLELPQPIAKNQMKNLKLFFKHKLL